MRLKATRVTTGGLIQPPGAGYLLYRPYNVYGEIRCRSVSGIIPKISTTVDLVIVNSYHPAHQEAMLYPLLADRLSERAFLMSDDSPFSDALFEFSVQTGRRFVLFQEKNEYTWCQEAGVGISSKK